MAVVLITGCSSGFGELIVKTLARDGHRVYASMRGVTDRNAAAADQLRAWAAQTNAALEVVELDVTSDASVAQAVTSILAQGHLDVVVNNAGIAVAGSFLDTTPEDWQRIVDINLMGVVHGCRLFGRADE